MWKLTIPLVLLFLGGCTTGLAPNGMTWDEYRSAKYRLKVIHYQAEEVVGCRELGPVRGASYAGIGESKDAAVEKAVLLGGNTLLIERLWSDWPAPRLIRRSEQHFTDGRAFFCGK